MTPPALAILDVGATLVTGPSRGPASRIAAFLGLDAAAKAALQEALMTRPFADPGEVAAFVRTLGGPARELADRAVREVWAAQHEEAEPIAGALDALEGLRAQGLRLALISNIWAPYLQSVRRHFGAFLDAHVEAQLQLLSFREGVAKPSPEPFRRVLDRAGVDAADAVMIGDSYAEDVEPAATLGLGTVWVLHRPERERGGLARILNGEALAPTRAVSSIADLTADVVASALGGLPRPAHA